MERIDELLLTQSELLSVVASVGFELHKWKTNTSELTNKFVYNNDISPNCIYLCGNEPSKTLEVYWDAALDKIKNAVNNTLTYDSYIVRKTLFLIKNGTQL